MGGFVCPVAPPVPELYCMGGVSGALGAPPVPIALPFCSLIGASCLQRGGCERERGDDVNMTSTCKGVGPLGMPVTGLTEPYLETGNRGELWRDTGGFLRESLECVRPCSV